MKYLQWVSATSALAMFLLTANSLSAEPANRASQTIDVQKSTITVHVFKSGALSAFGHDHEITAPIAAGSATVNTQHVELRIHANSLRVHDPKGSDKDRAEIQKTMLGSTVLDAERYPEIAFKSVSAEKSSAGWNLHGNLTLHGASRPVVVEVTGKDDHYTGHALVKQTDFGIKPVRVAGGAVRVKDEVRIDFDIQLAR